MQTTEREIRRHKKLLSLGFSRCSIVLPNRILDAEKKMRESCGLSQQQFYQELCDLISSEQLAELERACRSKYAAQHDRKLKERNRQAKYNNSLYKNTPLEKPPLQLQAAPIHFE